MSINSKDKLMISLKYVDKLKWSPELGKRLQELRGDISMRALAEKVSSLGLNCSHQYIYKLEDGRAEAVSTDIIVAICKVLGTDFKVLFPSAYLDISHLLAQDCI
ncbi:helix-turn-helix domain-containing protein [Calothrix sp. 336/3]|uniref:helix-turn-helix domain-containing protein n=1 Tax=Calothrix sp. 336/3 TaxID=1337936 RepID=UPI00055810E0|nr:helix-turn-helix transcriptional regulator [Calothrix sp. 336/3]AKG24884.1 hypothetical protein IJ00_26380 [Calothrix sp. 336/3]